MPRVVGIDHLVLSVGNFARSKDFYRKVLGFLGFKLKHEYPDMAGWSNGKTLFWIAAADAKGRKHKYRKGDIGFHHYAFELSSRKDVDALGAFLVEHGLTVVDPPGEYYEPSYYAVYFTDPDGMKLEGMVFKPPPKKRRAGKKKTRRRLGSSRRRPAVLLGHAEEPRVSASVSKREAPREPNGSRRILRDASLRDALRDERGSRRADSRLDEPLAGIPIHDVKQLRFFVPAARCCARVGLYPFAPDPKRGGRSADRRTISVVAFARRDDPRE